MFERLLVTAPGGESATRFVQAASRLGIVTQAPSSSASARDALSPAPVDAAAIVALARELSCGAVLPSGLVPAAVRDVGRAVRDAGLVFVGPSPTALDRIADRLALRAVAEEAGVRVVPGGGEAVTDLRAARDLADELGYPVVVKPVTGARGAGITWADDEDDLEGAVRDASERSARDAGTTRVYIEKGVPRARVVEIPVVADAHGTMFALPEREASGERSRRLVLVESPAPALSRWRAGESLRSAASDAALRVAAEIGLVGIATFELLVDPDGELFFLGATSSLGEMHAVTDLLLGIDTAELEMRIAAGEALAGPPRFVSGHAFEARIDAIDPSVGDAVADGTLEGATFPPAPAGKIRIDLVAGAGATFDAAHTLVARVTTQAAVRHLALLALDRMLAETTVAGPTTTNVAWLRKVLGHESFRAGQYDRTFCDHV